MYLSGSMLFKVLMNKVIVDNHTTTTSLYHLNSNSFQVHMGLSKVVLKISIAMWLTTCKWFMLACGPEVLWLHPRPSREMLKMAQKLSIPSKWWKWHSTFAKRGLITIHWVHRNQSKRKLFHWLLRSMHSREVSNWSRIYLTISNLPLRKITGNESGQGSGKQA